MDRNGTRQRETTENDQRSGVGILDFGFCALTSFKLNGKGYHIMEKDLSWSAGVRYLLSMERTDDGPEDSCFSG